MIESISDRIKNAKLTKKEKIVIEMITKDVEKTAFLSGVSLAEECGVSATFITRLIQKLGYDRFADFKEELGAIYKKATSPYDMFQHYIAGGNKNNVIKDTVVQDLQNLGKMESLLNYEVFDCVINAIEQSETIYISAIFASEIAVWALSHYLTRLGKNNKKIMGIGLSKQLEFSDIGNNDVLIAVSSQRVVKEIVQAANYAKSKGAIVVAITDNITNPLACVSDFTLLAPVKGVTVDYTHVATLGMINLIINSLAARTPEIVTEMLEKDDQKWADKDLFCL